MSKCAWSERVNASMGLVNAATQRNASASEELAATAEELSGQAKQLQSLIGFFSPTSGARRGGAMTALKRPPVMPGARLHS